MLTLLVVGRTGSGKSSVGNSILGSRTFSPRTTTERARLNNEPGSNDDFTVIDCSGIGDTGDDMASDIKAVIKSALDGVLLCTKVKKLSVNQTGSDQVIECKDNNKGQEGNSSNDTKNDCLPTNSEVEHVIPSQKVLTDATNNCADSIETTKCGFDALIFVIKYGVRFTKQEKHSVDMVKYIFGDNVFKDWGILVFSYGDNFYLDTEDDDIRFEDWCRKQTGDIKNLFEEIDYRCVIFDNKSRYNEKQILQHDLLKQYIKDIVNNRKQQYTRADIICAHVGQGKLLSKEEFEEIQSEVNRLIEESNDLFDKMAEKEVEIHAIMERIRKITSELQSEEQKLEEKDQGTGLLKDLIMRVTTQKRKIERFMARNDISAVNSRGLLDDTVESNVLSEEQDATVEQAESQEHWDSESLQSGCWNFRNPLDNCFKKKYKPIEKINGPIN